jgi:primosomal protein N' (replication factor Y)
MYYYKVSLGLEARWQKWIYTYSFDECLQIGSIVEVPFGKKKLCGIVVARSSTNKGDYVIKPIHRQLALPLPEKTQHFLSWMRQFYPSLQHNLVQTLFAPQYLLKKLETKQNVDRPQSRSTSKIYLSKSQLRTIKSLSESQDSILHGITGAGKTRIYSYFAKQAVEQKRSVLILLPEIGLTPTIINELCNYFDKKSVVVYHSQMTDSDRAKIWQETMDENIPRIIVGPRSCLFLPFKNLGLIVVDEFHDTSYKQDDGLRYDAIMVASGLGNIHQAKVIYGSATPSVTHTDWMLRKKVPLVCLHEQANNHSSTRTITVVDSKNRDLYKKNGFLSDILLKQIKQSLSKKKQVLLFLNRRGSARITLCLHCGEKLTCTNCSSTLVFHHDTYTNICHVCGRKERASSVCKHCGHSELITKTYGTKYIEECIHKLFPVAKIKRFDTDNKKAESLSVLYDAIRRGDFDILIGTQMLTKGIDLPLLETVGIIQAETSLYIPDFTSEERTFQQITQVIGRVGRIHGDGFVVLQTFQPENTVLKQALENDWHRFFDQELERRKKLKLPPHSMALVLTTNAKSANLAAKNLEKIKARIQHKNLNILGPAPSFHETKTNHSYTWQLIVLAKKRSDLLAIVNDLPKKIIPNLDPLSFM